jgi:YVTN family beta-propeller protein
VTTYHNDNARTGQNTSETALTPANVNSSHFGKLFARAVDGVIYAQPLYVSNLAIAGGTHNVVFVATEHDSVYAFDADSGAQLWKKSLILSGESTVTTPITPVCNNIVPEIGITSTPVIDLTSNTLYAVARTSRGCPRKCQFFQRLHALDIITGAEKFGGPTEIQASVPGWGLGSVAGRVSFDPLWQNQRVGLLLRGGYVYIAWASHCDVHAFHGWVMAYNATTLQQAGVWNDTPDGGEGGIWGGAPAADSDGNVYVATGNGTFNLNLQSNNQVYVTNQGSNTVTVIDPNNNYGTTTVTVGDKPTAVAVVNQNGVNTFLANPPQDNNKIYVANFNDRTVMVIDPATNSVISTVPVGVSPQALAGRIPVDYNDPLQTGNVYVANEGSNFVTAIQYDFSYFPVPVTVGSGPFAVAVNQLSDQIYVSNFFDNTVTVISGWTSSNTYTTTTVNVGTNPGAVAVNPATNKTYVANYNSGNVTVIDGATNNVIATVATGTNPAAVAVDPVTNKIYVANLVSNNVTVIDGATNTVTTTVLAGTTPNAVAVNPVANKIYLANLNSGNVTVIDGATNNVIATVAAGTNPVAVAVDPVTNKIYVANRGSSNVTVIDGATNTVITTVSVGPSPNALVVSETGDASDTLAKLGPPSAGLLPLTDYFTPSKQGYMEANDQDLGSAAALLLPDQPPTAPHQHLLAVIGKTGELYLVDRDNMGHFTSCSPACDSQIVQAIPNVAQASQYPCQPPPVPSNCSLYFNGFFFGMPAYWNNNIYVGGAFDPLRAFSFNAGGSGLLSLSPTSVSAPFPNPPAAMDWSVGMTPSVSASGNSNGILWAIDANQSFENQPAVLHAYDATNLARALYDTTQNAQDMAGPAVRFSVPTIANGKVYVPTQTELDVYGLAIMLTPASLTFAQQAIGTTSAAKTVTLTNNQTSALAITSVVAGGEFTETNTCSASVPALGKCTISVRFRPTATGTQTGSITITDNASTSPQTVALTGTGVPQATVSPTSLSFAAQTVGTMSPPRTVTLTNSLATALTITSVTFTGNDPADFSQSNTCGASLAAKKHCTISVTFKPTATGARTATLDVNDNANNSPQKVSLSGTGT